MRAETYDCVTVYFSDIEGFTAMSASLTPMQVMKGAETQTASQRISAKYILSRPYRHFEKTNNKKKTIHNVFLNKCRSYVG